MSPRLLQGNAACALGALAAGCRFFGGYPITPSTEIAEVMARELPKVRGTFIQMEDEIASIAAVLGASVGGVKAMTATSGPGFSLMQENIGYAAMAEIPCVIVNVQRAGPSTGLPTSPSQGDVMQARWGSHGDHPIIALSPSTVREAFDLTVCAFNFSEKYRTPVILLMDEVVGHMRERTELPVTEMIEVVDRIQPNVPPAWYFPYEETSADVPPFASFGEGYRFHITGLFHDRAGFPTLRLDEIQPWLERVFNKITRHVDDITQFQEEWVDDAATVVVAYGATARSAREAVKIARQGGRKVGLVKLLTLWPFPNQIFRRLARQGKRFVMAEMNLGQLSLELERVVGRKRVRGVHRADGQMITPGEILEAIRRRQTRIEL
jgi:2-oxoglutarate ferredoxin oxidoreductase subunit alpha